VVQIQGTLSQGAAGRLQIVLRGEALPGGGVAVATSQVELAGPTGGVLYHGTVTTLDGSRIIASMTGVEGSRLLLSVDLSIDQFSGSVSGVVVARVA